MRGIPIRVDSRHAIAHNEVIIVDSRTVLQGSFDFSQAGRDIEGKRTLR
jgi:hypothetical protein